MAELKSIKETVRATKQRLKALHAEGGEMHSREIVDLEAELAMLKEKWEQWEKKRQDAQEERMAILGHR